MAPTCGKLEHQITVPTGGWDTTVGGGTATVSAGTYYMNSAGSETRSFLSEIATRFASAASTTCAVTASHGEVGTGIVTITFGTAKAITWVDNEVRDLLGFEANSASATTHTGTLSACGIWLPTSSYWTLNGGGDWRGVLRADMRSVYNAAGHVWNHYGQRRTELDLRWGAIKRARVWVVNEMTGNQSLERFWIDGIWGEASWGTPGGPLRWHADADDNANYGTYRVVDAQMFSPEQASENYVGSWRIQMPKMIQVPGTETVGVWRLPDDAVEWAEVFPSITVPTALWPMQDAALPAADAIASYDIDSGNASGDERVQQTGDTLDRYSILLEGLASHLRCATTAELDLTTNDFTVFFRFKVHANESPASGHYFARKKSSSAATNGWAVVFDGTNGYLDAILDSPASTESTATISVTHDDGAWHWAMAAIDRTNAQLRMYSDLGTTTTSISAHAGGSLTNGMYFGIGDTQGNLNACAIADYSYMAVWVGTALTQTEFDAMRGGG